MAKFNRKSTQAWRSDARKRHNFQIRIAHISPLRARRWSVLGWICSDAAASRELRNLSKCGKGWLTGVAACISLIKPSTARVGTGLKSPCCLMVGCGVRLPSTDFEPIHYSAGVNLRVIGGREHIRRNRTRRICCFLSENLLSRRLRKNLSRSARRTSSTFRYAFRESKGTDH